MCKNSFDKQENVLKGINITQPIKFFVVANCFDEGREIIIRKFNLHEQVAMNPVEAADFVLGDLLEYLQEDAEHEDQTTTSYSVISHTGACFVRTDAGDAALAWCRHFAGTYFDYEELSHRSCNEP